MLWLAVLAPGAEHARRAAAGEPNAWILKPAVGTHGVGHVLVRTLGEAAAVFRQGTASEGSGGSGTVDGSQGAGRGCQTDRIFRII